MNKDINLKQIFIDADLYQRNRRAAKESERKSSPAKQQEVNFVSNGIGNKKGKGGGKGKRGGGRGGNNVRGGYSGGYN